MDIQFARVRRGEYAGAIGDEFIGRVLGDYSTGFDGYRTDGRRLMTPMPYPTPEEAFEALALEHTFQHGALAGAA